MAGNALISRIWNKGKAVCRHWRRDRRGFITLVNGAMLAVLIAAMGLAIDSGRGYYIKSRMSQAIDSACLAGARNYFVDSDRQGAIQNYFFSNFTPDFMTRMGVTLSNTPATPPYTGSDTWRDGVYVAANRASNGGVSTNLKPLFAITPADPTNNTDTMVVNGQMQITVKAKINTLFAGIFRTMGDLLHVTGGFHPTSSVEFQTTCLSQRESMGIDVVLSIDISGSMSTQDPGSSNTRITSAKNAAKSLVDILFNNALTDPATGYNSQIQVGLVPWNAMVRVAKTGVSYNAASGSLAAPPDGGGNYTSPYEDPNMSDGANGPDGRGGGRYPLSYGGNPDFKPVGLISKPVLGNQVYYANNAPDVALYRKPNAGWTGCVYSPYIRQVHPTDASKTLDDGVYGSSFDTPAVASGKDFNNDLRNGYRRVAAGGGIAAKDWVAYMPVEDESYAPNSSGTPYPRSKTTARPKSPSGTYSRVCAISEPWDSANHNLNDTNRLSTKSSNEACSDCPTVGIQPLTFYKNTVKTAINSLAAGGTTNINAGLYWAYQVLTPQAPYTQQANCVAPCITSPRQHAIVLLTDGRNNPNRGDTFNRADSAAAGETTDPTVQNRNKRLKLLAQNIKADPFGIDLYIIQTGGDNFSQAEKDFMAGLATQPTAPFYYFAPNSDDLNHVFQQIAINMSHLRLTR